MPTGSPAPSSTGPLGFNIGVHSVSRCQRPSATSPQEGATRRGAEAEDACFLKRFEAWLLTG